MSESQAPAPTPVNAEEVVIRRRVRRRAMIGLLLFLLVLPVGIFGYMLVFLKNTLPPTNGQIRIPGITAEVVIHRDEMGIPQIFAATEADAYYGLGFVHASDRLFQMELVRRMASGRLSQLLGDESYESDIEARLLGHRRLAAEQVKAFDGPARELVDAYVLGINSFMLRTGKRSFEFKVLRAPFDSWTVEEVLAVLSWNTWFVQDMLSDDRAFLDLFEQAGREKAAAVRYDYPGDLPTIVAALDERPGASDMRRLASALRPTTASNAFVVSGERSASGKSLIACDPHVDVTFLPGLWYIAGLHVEEPAIDAVGVTMPGLPALSMGHTQTTAWGFTAAGFDLVDYFIEEVDPDDPDRYRTPDGYAAFERIADTIPVRGESTPRALDIRISRHGPIVRDLTAADPSEPPRAVALRWAGRDSDLAAGITAAMRLPKVTDFDEFRRTVTSIAAANLSWVWAHADGEIGYQLGAPVPIRGSEETQLPLEGWIAANDWQGYRPLEETPAGSRPEQGWIASCNNKPAGASVDYPLPGTFVTDRVRRATQLLSGKEIISADDLVAAQADRIDLELAAWGPLAAEVLEGVGEAELARKARDWNGDMDPDSRLAAVISAWRFALREAAFVDEMGYRGSMRMLDQVLADDVAGILDDTTTDPGVESRAEALAGAMRTALEWTDGKSLGEAQPITFRHPFWRARGSGFLGLVRGSYARGGSTGTLDSSFPRRATRGAGLETGVAPSWRYVLDFADVDGCRMVIPGGQSGNPMSPHFFDFFKIWRENRYHTVPLSKDKVEAAATQTLRLIP